MEGITKKELTSNIINRMTSVLNDEQLQSLKEVLYIEFYSLNIERSDTQISTKDDSYKFRLEDFIEAKRMEGRSEGTLKRYYEINIAMLNFIRKPVEQITTEDIRYYLPWYRQNRKAQLCTLDGMRLCIGSFFHWLHVEQYINDDPSLRVRKIKFCKKVKEVITDKNLELLRANCKTRKEYALLEFFYSTGVRVGEVMRLNISDIDFHERNILVNGKGNKQRIVKISEPALVRLELYLQERSDNEKALFVTSVKPYRRMDRSGIRAALKRIAKRAGIDQNIYPHAMRTKFATDMSKHGAPIEHVAMLLGHENINTTRIYSLTSLQDLSNTYRRFNY